MSPANVTRRSFLQTAGAGAAGLAASAVTGCAQQPAQRKAAGGRTAIDWMGVPHALDKDPWEVAWSEKRFALDLKTISVEGDYAAKQQQLLASGTIPDVMYIVAPEFVQKLASQGLLMELPWTTVEKYAPKQYAATNKHEPRARYYSRYSGKNYGFDPLSTKASYGTCMAWRTDLLKKAGIDFLPESIQQYEQALPALKQIGVYGLSTSITTQFFFHQIFGAYGVMPTQWDNVGGKMVNGSVRPEAKQALQKLAEWYKKGYIDPNFPAMKDSSAYYGVIAKGKVASYDTANAGLELEPSQPRLLTTVKSTVPQATVALARPPHGPGGRGVWGWGIAGPTIALGSHLAKDPGKVRKILQVWDQIYGSKEANTTAMLGQEGTMWKYKDQKKGLVGGYTWIGKYADPARQGQEGIFPAYIGWPNAELEPFYYYTQDQWSAMAKYGRYTRVDYFGGAVGVIPSSAKYFEDLGTLKDTTYTAIITGAKPISAFDDFVHDWRDAGGAELEKDATALHEEMKKDPLVKARM